MIVRGILLKGNGFAEVANEFWPTVLFAAIALTVGGKPYQQTLDESALLLLLGFVVRQLTSEWHKAVQMAKDLNSYPCPEGKGFHIKLNS